MRRGGPLALRALVHRLPVGSSLLVHHPPSSSRVPVRSLHHDAARRLQAEPAATTSAPTPTLATDTQAEQQRNRDLASVDRKLGDDMAQADLAATPAVEGAVTAPTPDPFLSQTKNTFEIKDPELIFRQVWTHLKEKYGEENLCFPKEIMWLAGAPGAGKGAMTPIIQQYRGIMAQPIEVGALLTSPAAQALKAQGKLVGDQQVMELLLEALLKPEYATGVVVDGFPRTREQAECIKLLFDAIQGLRAKYGTTPEMEQKFRRPIFHITVLYIDKEESVKRQMRRGQLAVHHNEMVTNTGVGDNKPVRETDLSPALAAERYRMFKVSAETDTATAMVVGWERLGLSHAGKTSVCGMCELTVSSLLFLLSSPASSLAPASAWRRSLSPPLLLLRPRPLRSKCTSPSSC